MLGALQELGHLEPMVVVYGISEDHDGGHQKEVGGGPNCWRLRILYAFEVYLGERRLCTRYSLIAALRGAAGGGTTQHLEYLACHVVKGKDPPPKAASKKKRKSEEGTAAASEDGGKSTGDEHIGLELEFSREPYIECRRDDVPPPLLDCVRCAGNVGPLLTFQDDEYDRYLIDDSGAEDESASHIVARSLLFRWLEAPDQLKTTAVDDRVDFRSIAPV